MYKYKNGWTLGCYMFSSTCSCFSPLHALYIFLKSSFFTIAREISSFCLSKLYLLYMCICSLNTRGQYFTPPVSLFFCRFIKGIENPNVKTKMHLRKICCSLKNLETIKPNCYYNLNKRPEEDTDLAMTLVAKQNSDKIKLKVFLLWNYKPWE